MPVAPDAPVGPVEPAAPVAPVAPVAPAGPVAPVAPTPAAAVYCSEFQAVDPSPNLLFLVSVSQPTSPNVKT